jgi:molybdopterin synthase catalytic subunit
MKVLEAEFPALGPLMKHLRVAVEQEFATGDTVLRDGAQVALIPPVAGGAPEVFKVVARPLEVQEVIDAVSGPDHGGVVTFTGAVRNVTGGRTVLRLEYEAFAPMAEKVFHAIAEEARAQWPGVRIAVMHRVGTLEPGALAVVIAASAPNRQSAFAACQHTIERLKHDAPIWKKEFFEDGEVWVGLGP